ncbi:Vacuolar protein sorting-associated protein 5 [Ceratobasidium sp. UAMH 11750]|nr:Vacuolar protein sorting-associated protein 5 [Ceratobasidium sp. UAMH 11750]
MSGTFGGGFGGDFDDLLPTRSPAPPNMSNPFEDPFADIGRTQENDPWASYDHQKTGPPAAQSHDAFYQAPPVESHSDLANDFGYKPSPPSPIYEPPVNTYSAPSVPEPEPTTPVVAADPAVLDYRAPSPPLSGPLATFPDPSPPTPPAPAPAPAARPPAVPISPSKAGLFDEPSGSTFGSGFVRRHKTQRSSTSSATGQPSAEGRVGSLFSSAKADPLEALVSKARSVSIARTTPPVTPKPELAPEIKPRLDEKAADPLATTAESPTAAEAISHDVPATPEVETLTSFTPPDVPVAPATIDESTPKESPARLGSQTPARSATPTADVPVPEPSTPSAVPQPEETPSAPTPPSRAASESHISQYPEGSTFLQPPQDSPGPGAYARVVSPLDTPATNTRDLGQSFSGLALGGEVPNLGWGGQAPPPSHATLTPTTRSAGWGPVDSTGGWGGEAAQTGWGGENEATFIGQSTTSLPGQGGEAEDSASGHSRKPSESNESEGTGKDAEGSRRGTPQQVVPRQSGSAAAGSTFVITVGDPQKVGDPINPYIGYTVSTKTTSPLYRKPNFSVLRRYSDFLWLFETLSLNKPGVFIPPVPEKQGFGRFQGAFVEARRLALNNCIQKIANHPLLSTDDDFKFFIESDSFALDVKHRKAEIAQEKTGGFLSSITGPKFYEVDEWFDTKRSYIDALESQLRGLAKSVETVSKHRADVATATAEFAETIVILASSDLSKQLSQSLAALADVHKKARKLEEEQSQDNIILLMGIVEEYIRLIGSIRLTFTSRIRLHASWQNANAEAKRVRTVHEKARRQGKIPQDRVGVAMHEMAEAEKRAADAKHEFDQCSRLIKAEMARFEKERIDDFKKNLEELLEGMIRRQQDLIESLENYQEGLLRRSKSIIGQAPAEPPEPQLGPAPN